MSGALTTVIEGTLDTLADVAEHSGGLVGTAQAQSLAGEIKAFGLIVPSMPTASAADFALIRPSTASGKVPRVL